MKRKVSDDKLRDIVRARITKGDAFRLDGPTYDARQEEVKAQLASMSRKEIMAQYSYATYDIQP